MAYSAIVGDAPYSVTVTATKGAPVTSDTFTVTSSNPSVANVSLNGTTAIISPVAAGNANILFTTGSGVTKTIAATVAPDQTSLTLSPASLTYSAIAGSAPYTVTVTSTKKDGVTAGPFTVSSSNTAVATATASGNIVTITPVGAGTANIVFTSSSNASVTKTIAATVAPDQTQISLSPAALTYSAVAGSTPYNVTVTAVKNDGVTPDTFTASSSNPAVADVSVNGSVVTIAPLAAGTANITIASGSEPTKVKKTIAATISAATPNPSLTLSPASLTYSAAAGSTPYHVTVTALKNDGVSADTFTVSSDNTAVATVSPSSGTSPSAVTITPVAPGTANVTITTGTGLTSTIAVTVTAATKATITLSPAATTYSAVAGSTPYVVTVTALRSDGVTADTFTVSSSNASVASVSPSGGSSGNQVTITPIAAGTATITFTSGSDSTVTAAIATTITAASVSGCDGTEWFCDDFQKETIGANAASNWDLTPFGNNALFTVVSDPVTPANTVLQYYAGTSSLDIVPPGQVIALVKDSVWANIPNKSDYYFEARIKPQNNSKTASKELYMIGRYQDNSNWYFAGPNLQSTSRVDVGYMKAGTVSQVSKTNTPIVQGTQGGNDGQWYTFHFEMVGGVETLFLNGVQMGASVNDTTFASGKFGLFTYNKSFLIDDIRVGAVQLVLSPNTPTYTAAALSTPYVVNVTAVQTDGVTPDTFTVSSSNTSVVTVSVSGNAVTITPVGQGTANIVFTSGSNPTLTRTIAATITAPVVTTSPVLTLSPSATTYNAVAGSSAYNVTVTAITNDGVTADTFTVASSNPSVASVAPASGSNGTVVAITPLSAGNATITFTSGSGLTATIAATITANLAQITLSPSSLTYDAIAGSTPYQVTVTAVKSDGTTADTFTVSSSNTAVATASASGNVVTITPVAAGTANIVITSTAGVTKTIAATISPNLSAITLSPSASSFTAVAGGAPYTFTVTALKSDGSADTFTASSSNTAAATVAVVGNVVSVTPVAVGTSNIVITSGSGLTSTVVANISTNLAQITLSPSATTYSAVAGSTPYSVTVTALQSDGTTADTFTVSSDNTAVATVAQNGNQVSITPVAAGTANIIFTSGSGKTATIAVTVTPAKPTITLSPSASYTAFAGGSADVVTVTALKSDNSADTFTVASSDSNVASVSPSTGTSGAQVTITPVAAGTATITFTSGSDSTVTATIGVTVTANNSALTLTPPATSYTWNVGGAAHSVIISAVQADGKTPDTFTVSTDDNGAVATVTQNVDQLTITPIAQGTSHITITSGSGKTATITLSVNSAVSHCDGTEWFCDDFQKETVGATTVSNWDLTTTAGQGTFNVVQDADNTANVALQYTYGTSAAVIALIKDSVWANVAPHLNATGDYFVEAHLKPQQAGHNKQLYMVSHYTDANNWYGGGYNYSGPRLETAYKSSGTLTAKYAQGTSPNTSLPAAGTQGAGAGKEGTWITVRFEVLNGNGAMYLNGVKDSKTVKAFPSLLTSGKIGLYTDYNNFLIDDIRVGDPSNKPTQPAQLTVKSALGTSVTAYTAEVGDAVTPVTVTALKGDGTADTYYAASSNPAVVIATVDPGDSTGKTIDFTPVSAGTANIIFFSASDPNVSVTVAATVGPQFVQPATTYTLSDGQLMPAPGATNAYVDDHLVLTFDSTPTLNGTGSVRIFKSADDTLVDVIPLTGATDLIGLNYSSNVRAVNTTPIWVSGNSVVIAPHQSKLSYDTSYYVAISDGSITGTLSGQNFTGIGKVGGWSFTTKNAPAASLTALAVNGTGTSADFRTVQGALNYAMQNASTYTASTPLTINVASGTYQELLFLRNVSNVTINGAGQSQTTIQYENYDSMNTGSGGSSSATAPTLTGGRSVFLVEGSDMLTLTNLTLKNTHLRKTGLNNQAETIYFNSDSGRLIAKNAEFDSEQDTLLLKGYDWFYQTLVTGNVDYIWGYSHAALFENSEIRTVGDSSSSTPSGGYLVQARVASLSDKGFIFLNSTLTNGTGPGGQVVANGTNGTAATYLARSGGASGAYDNVLYINCKMDSHIAPLGWAAPGINGNPNPTPATATATSGWREYVSLQMDGTTLLDVTQRSAYSYQMQLSDITTYGFDTRANIFSAYPGGWNPQP